MLVSGRDLDETEYTCFLPVFRNPQSVNDYTLGSLFLEDHIWVFDNSHRDERGDQFLTIGFGQKAVVSNSALSSRYDKNSKSYQPSKEDQSVEIKNEEESLFDTKDGLLYELNNIKTEIEDVKNSAQMFKDKIAALEGNLTESQNKYEQQKKEMNYAKTKHEDLIKQRTLTRQT